MIIMVDFPGGSDCEESAYNAGNSGFPISGSGMSLGEGNGYLRQYSCLENTMDRRSLVGYTPWGHKESDMTQRLSNNCHQAHLLVEGCL